MTTAGNLVFQSEGNNLAAYRADNGEKLWTGNLGVRAGSAAMTYQLDGVQYVAALANARVVVFKLGGNATLPPVAAAAQPQQLNPPANFGTDAQITAGKSTYTASCSICHEGQARNSTQAPDLSYSQFLASNALFRAVVIDGAKMDGGMKSFKGALSDDAVEALRAHLVSVANELKNNPQAAGGGRGFGGPGGPPGGGRGAGPGGPPGGGRGAGAGPAAAPQPAAPAEPPVGLHQ
jgi:mono/diheme cytochrome c family protein